MNFDQDTKILLIEALISGIIWTIMFYYIRKGLNKRNFLIDDPNKKRMDFWYDAMYGGLAAFLALIAKKLVTPQIKNILL